MILTSTRRAIPWPSIALSAFGLLTCGACSTDSSGAPADASSGTGGATSSGTGGSSAKDGSTHPGTGGKAPFDAAAASKCGADAGAATQCELCLETLCCKDYSDCLKDPVCADAFSTYRSCILKPKQMDQPGCLSAFGRNNHTDASNHDGIYSCIFGLITSGNNSACQICGGASIL